MDFRRSLEDGKEIADAMGRTMVNRGPDEGGTYHQTHVWLIHRRLAVVDPENGKQPMYYNGGGDRYCMVYNGELYNTEELRSELKSLGHRFAEHSDTEVLLHAMHRSPTSGTRGTLGAISPRGALALRAAHRAAKKLETNTGGK